MALDTAVSALGIQVDGIQTQLDGGLQHTSATWTNAQLKAGTTLTVVPAPGVGKRLEIVNVTWTLLYGGNNAFTNAPAMAVYTGSYYTLAVPASTTLWQATEDSLLFYNIPNFAVVKSQVDNGALIVTLASALTGNAANDNTVVVEMDYYIETI